jgi:adenylate cyclase
MISDPDIFAALGLIGFTVAAPFSSNGKLLGVAAADITLDDLGAYLADRKVSPRTLSYILDGQGRVIAASDLSKTYTSVVDGRLELRHISSLDDTLPAVAFAARPRGSEDMFSLKHDGTEYLASVSTLASEFGKKWQLFIITPLSDFTGPFQRNNDYLVAFGLAATVIQILIIFLLTSVVSAPLEKLAFKVGKIQELGTTAAVHQLADPRDLGLSKAIDTRYRRRFRPSSRSAGHPAPQTEQKLELGGGRPHHLLLRPQAFSSLSEEVPSQELPLRVSALSSSSPRPSTGARHVDKF